MRLAFTGLQPQAMKTSAARCTITIIIIIIISSSSSSVIAVLS